MKQIDQKHDEIRDAHVQLLVSTDRLLRDASDVKQARDRLMDLLRESKSDQEVASNAR